MHIIGSTTAAVPLACFTAFTLSQLIPTEYLMPVIVYALACMHNSTAAYLMLLYFTQYLHGLVMQPTTNHFIIYALEITVLQALPKKGKILMVAFSVVNALLCFWSALAPLMFWLFAYFSALYLGALVFVPYLVMAICHGIEKTGLYCLILNTSTISYKTNELCSLLGSRIDNLPQLHKAFNFNLHQQLTLAFSNWKLFEYYNMGMHKIRNTTLQAHLWAIQMWPLSIALIVCEDKKSEDLLQKEKETVEQTNIQFSSCAHEIKNQLNTLLLLLKNVKDKIQSSQPLNALKSLRTIKFAVQHSLLISKSLLDVGSILHGNFELHFEKISLKSLLSGIYEIYNAQIKDKGITFELRCDPNLPSYIRTDKMRITQILINLISNSLKFTQHGIISLTSTLLPGKLIEFTVSDTGIGIRKESFTRIGSPFFMANQKDKNINPQGTGLGVMISMKIASMIGKGLKFESQENIGTKFKFTVDISQEDETVLRNKTEYEYKQ